VWHSEASQGTGVVLETVWYDQNAGNAKFHGAEHLGTIQPNHIAKTSFEKAIR
jgi:hypothetical protein